MTGFFWWPLKLGERLVILQIHHDVECHQKPKAQLEFLHAYQDESARGHRVV